MWRRRFRNGGQGPDLPRRAKRPGARRLEDYDPYRLTHEADVVEIDLGAERTIAAQRGGELIAVEIKSFLGESPLRDFETALGQFGVNEVALREHEPDRRLLLAVTELAYDEVFTRPLVRLVCSRGPSRCSSLT